MNDQITQLVNFEQEMQKPMAIKSITSEQELENALKRVDEIWDARPNTAEGDELDALAKAIEAYENSLIRNDVSPFKKSNVKFKPVDFD